MSFFRKLFGGGGVEPDDDEARAYLEAYLETNELGAERFLLPSALADARSLPKHYVNDVPVPDFDLEDLEVGACESPSTMFRKSPCDDKPVKFSGKTNEKGVFTFEGVPVGSYGFAIKPSPEEKWRVTLASDCCAKLQEGKTYDVGSFDLSR